MITSNPKIRREDRRTVSVHKDTWVALDAIGERGETFDEIIRRLLSSYRAHH